MFIVNDTKKFILVTFAKSGCSTLRLAVTRMLYPDLTEDEQLVKYHSVQQSFIEFEKLASYHVVCVYRNTFERLASTFVDKILQYPTSVKEKFVPYYSGQKTFHAFIQYLEDVAHLPETDVHFQHQYISKSIVPYIDEYVDIRNLDSIFSHDLELRDEFLSHCTRMNVSSQRNDVCYNLSYYDFETDVNGLRQSALVPSYRNFFNNTLIRQIERVYKEEMDRFGIVYPWKRDFTFISNSCSGWTLERRFSSAYNNPFIGSLIPNDEDYVKLCENFDYYMTLTPTIIDEDQVNMTKKWHVQTGRRRWFLRDQDVEPYVITRLDDVEIHWIHELDPVEFLKKYERRRFRYRDCIPIFTWAEQQNFVQLERDEREKLRRRFLALPSFTMLVLREVAYPQSSTEQHRIECPYPASHLMNTTRNGNNNFTTPVPEGVDTSFLRMFESIKRHL